MTEVARGEPIVAPSEAPAAWPVPKRVLAAVDHSEPSRWAAGVAAALAAGLGADLRIVHVFEPAINPRSAGTRELLWEGVQFVAEFPARLPAGARTRLDRVFRTGPAGQEIVVAADEWAADVIVAGTHGRRGVERLLLGSTAEGILRHARCPVLCVGHPPRNPVTFGRIVVAVDESAQAGWASAAAAQFGRCLGCAITLVHVAPCAALIDPDCLIVSDRPDEALREAGAAFLARQPWPAGAPKPERQVRQGPTVDEILAAAGDWRADLIFLGTHARHGLSRLLLGSTAEAVVRRAACPVLCVGHRPPAADAAGFVDAAPCDPDCSPGEGLKGKSR